MKIFVIMPFSKTTERHTEKYWDDFYKSIYQIIKEKNFNIIKDLFGVDDFELYRASAPQGNIVKGIIKDLIESDIVISVLTDHNPNVFYELGIRHTQPNKNTIMLCEDAVSIPFDLKNYGVGIYKDNTRRSSKIEQELMKRFKEIASSISNPDNPFLDFAEHSGIVLPKNNILKVNIVNNIEGEKLSHPPRFYREVERTPRNNIKFSNRTVFTFIIEILSYGSESISLLNTELAVDFNSQKYFANKIYNETTVLISKALVSIRSDYKQKFTIEPKTHYQFNAAFILDKFVPPEIKEIEGYIQIEDMYGNKYKTPEFLMKTYTEEPEKILLKMKLMEKFGEGSNEYNWRVRLIEEKGPKAISIDEIM